MKRVVVFFMALVMFLTLVPTFTSAEGGYLWMVDAPSGVNVRDSKKGGAVIACFRKGEIFLVCEEDSYWVGTLLEDGTMGYIYKENCHIAHAEEIEEWEKRKKLGVKITNEDAKFIGEILEDCKVYKKANGKVIGEFFTSQEVYVRQLGKYWYKVIWNDKEVGFVQSKFVRLLDVNIPGDGEIKRVFDDETWNSSFTIREKPESKSKKVYSIQSDSYVRIVGPYEENGYILVAYNSNGDTGYIRTKWLKRAALFEKE